MVAPASAAICLFVDGLFRFDGAGTRDEDGGLAIERNRLNRRRPAPGAVDMRVEGRRRVDFSNTGDGLKDCDGNGRRAWLDFDGPDAPIVPLEVTGPQTHRLEALAHFSSGGFSVQLNQHRRLLQTQERYQARGTDWALLVGACVSR
jgi:hypothetical protein